MSRSERSIERSVERSGDEFVVDAELVAGAFRLPAASVRSLMRDGGITSRCEAGEGEDAGRWRLTFFHGERVCRFTIDADGSVRRATWTASPRPRGAAAERRGADGREIPRR